VTKILVVDDSAVDRGHINGIIKQATNWEVEFAEDGEQALKLLAKSTPDVVLTDLLMPNMNGLELVASIRRLYPALPVVLVTSQGSEDLAIRALREGASSYTPKRLLSSLLVETVRTVASAAARIKNQKRLMTNVVNGSISWRLENDVSLVVPLVEQVQAFVSDWSESDQLRLGMAVDEALVNAIYHGNLEVDSQLKQEDDSVFYDLAEQRSREKPFAERRVFIDAQFSPEQVQIKIRDEGPGFDPHCVPDPTDPENLDRICGRGLLLIRTFMDDVIHNEIGNQISLLKRRSTDDD
jgi:CheY-like chemotaxis protein/anti-sigma regulatory factor (Ser/Thr protein kinase)